MIDILIPNYNGAAWLPICLAALARQTRTDFLITVIDDASRDDSVELLQRAYPHVQIIRMAQNRGFAAAVNRGIEATARPYVILLNNDTEAEPDFVAELIGGLERQPQAAFAAAKMRLFERRDHLHSTGDYYRFNGEPGSRGVWQRDVGQYDQAGEVFGPCAGAAAYRRSALDALRDNGAVFDEALIMYCEDVDLNLRARRAGMRTWYVPTAVVYHQLSATGGGALASYYCGRNFTLVWAKNLPQQLARRHWPQLLARQLRYSVEAILHLREPAARARLRGQLAGLRDLPQFLRRRPTMDDRAAAEFAAAVTQGLPESRARP
jgi:GT2 family glycosyltransferase